MHLKVKTYFKIDSKRILSKEFCIYDLFDHISNDSVKKSLRYIFKEESFYIKNTCI